MLAIRLDAIATPVPVTWARACLECGRAFTALKPTADFCDSPCRKAWNNRRMTRGAELYDLFMALRYDRPSAQVLHVWRLICRMAMAFRAEDTAEREGRKSWRDPAEVLRRHNHTHLYGTVVGRGIQGRRGRG